MSESNRAQQPRLSPARLAFSLVVVLGSMAALLFVPAGRLDWIEAWALIAAYGVLLAGYAWWGLRRDPDQLRERGRAHRAANVKPWDKKIMAAYTVLLLLTLVVAGLDAGRYRWSAVPLPAKLLAWLALAAAGALVLWAIRTNTYLSRMARIQEDRGQVVVTAGPYRHVRHPMYLGIIILFLGMPVALGSWWALLPGAAMTTGRSSGARPTSARRLRRAAGWASTPGSSAAPPRKPPCRR